jgi:hypothetical protein
VCEVAPVGPLFLTTTHGSMIGNGPPRDAEHPRPEGAASSMHPTSSRKTRADAPTVDSRSTSSRKMSSRSDADTADSAPADHVISHERTMPTACPG